MYGHVTCMYLYIHIYFSSAHLQQVYLSRCCHQTCLLVTHNHLHWTNNHLFLRHASRKFCGFLPEDVCPRKGCGFSSVSSSSLLGGDDLIFNLTFSNVAKDTPQRNCWLWNIIPTFCSWKELIYLGDFLLSRSRSPTRRSWQNFFLLFTDRYDQFEANAKTRM